MNQPREQRTRRTRTKWFFGLVVIALLLAGVLSVMTARVAKNNSAVGSAAIVPVAVSRTNLVLVGGRLCLSGQTNAFTGLMYEHSSGGSLRSRSAVTNGLLHGLSEGWHTNGQLQVTEYFKEGVSHGLRTKWYADGTKLSEATIVEGKLHGAFRRWHSNGALAEEVQLKEGQPDGLAKAYFPSGFMKSRTAVRNGNVVDQKLWKDGEHKQTFSASGQVGL